MLQALDNAWKDHVHENLGVARPDNPLLNMIELVLDQDNNLIEVKRLPGENKVIVMLFS